MPLHAVKFTSLLLDGIIVDVDIGLLFISSTQATVAVKVLKLFTRNLKLYLAAACLTSCI